MFNKPLLKGKMAEREMSTEKLANLIGINVATLHRKIVGKSEFTLPEVQAARLALRLTVKESEQIFFAQELAHK